MSDLRKIAVQISHVSGDTRPPGCVPVIMPGNPAARFAQSKGGFRVTNDPLIVVTGIHPHKITFPLLGAVVKPSAIA